MHMGQFVDSALKKLLRRRALLKKRSRIRIEFQTAARVFHADILPPLI